MIKFFSRTGRFSLPNFVGIALAITGGVLCLSVRTREAGSFVLAIGVLVLAAVAIARWWERK